MSQPAPEPSPTSSTSREDRTTTEETAATTTATPATPLEFTEKLTGGDVEELAAYARQASASAAEVPNGQSEVGGNDNPDKQTEETAGKGKEEEAEVKTETENKEEEEYLEDVSYWEADAMAPLSAQSAVRSTPGYSVTIITCRLIRSKGLN